MRLARVVIRNFKAIGEIELVLPKTDCDRPGSADFLSLVGKNNAGKSSVLEVLLLALPETGITKPPVDYFPCRDENKGPIEVELHFDDLDKHDREQQGIRAHVHDNMYRVKKVWNSANSSPTVWAYKPRYEYPMWPNPDTSMAHFQEAGDGWPELLDAYREQVGELPPRVNKEFRQQLENLAIRIDSPLVHQTEAEWVQNPGGISQNVDTVLPVAIFVPAVKETKEEAEITQRKSAARQIVEAMFTRELAGNEAVEKFTEAGEAVRELFAGETGSEIIRGVERRITTRLSRFIELEASLDFEPPDVKADLASKTVLEIVDCGVRTRPEHQGNGAQRTLIFSLLELLAEDSSDSCQEANVFRRGTLFLVEEPEIYLHPQMCRKMRDVLVTIARSGTAQVVCTTHSPVFIDLADRHDGIAIFQKTDEGVSVFQRVDDLFGGEGAQDDRDRLRMLLNFDAVVNEVFFARRVCLVEGDCEIAALDAVARRLERDGFVDWEKYLLSRRDLVLVNCRGKWTIRAFQRVLNGFNIPYCIVHDLDAEGEEGANAAILELLDGQENSRLTHDPNFERQIFSEEWTKDKPWKAHRRVSEIDNFPDDLVTFFTFVLGVDLQELAP